MKLTKILFTALLVIGLASCNDGKKEQEGPNMESESMQDSETMDDKNEREMEGAPELTVQLASKSNSNARGTVNFMEENGKVTMKADLNGLAPGTHAIHIHENADCSAPDGTSAGGHWNPTFEKHGKWGDADGYHKGDIGNFEVSDDGTGSVSMTTDEWCIGCDDNKKNIVGKSIIVHAGADDFTSQPSGDAGGRVSCGGIIQ